MSARIIQLGAERRDEWNAFVARELSAALLQSWEWGEFKERLGWKAYRLAAEADGRLVAGAQLLIRLAPLGLASVAYVPRGPVGAWQEPGILRPLMNELHRVAGRHRALFLKVEPCAQANQGANTVLRDLGFRRSAYTNQPRATIVLDLRAGLDKVLGQMSRSTRHNLNLGKRNGLSVRLGDASDLDSFYRLMQMTARRAGFPARTLSYYRQEWESFAPRGEMRLFLASLGEEVVAANLSALVGGHAVYMHGVSSGAGSKLRPNYALMWEAIQWANTCGASSFDLWGVPDEVGYVAMEGHELPGPDREGGLWGVYRFKRGFGGETMLYEAGHDYAYLPVLGAVMGRDIVRDGVFDRAAAWADSLRGV